MRACNISRLLCRLKAGFYLKMQTINCTKISSIPTCGISEQLEAWPFQVTRCRMQTRAPPDIPDAWAHPTQPGLRCKCEPLWREFFTGRQGCSHVRFVVDLPIARNWTVLITVCDMRLPVSFHAHFSSQILSRSCNLLLLPFTRQRFFLCHLLANTSSSVIY